MVKFFNILFFLSLMWTTERAASPAEMDKSLQFSGSIKPTVERMNRGKAIYSYYCSPCHGMRGNGLGPNAENLSTRPRNFTDKPYMDTKNDRDLFQVIKGGGSAVGLSFLMPPWGNTLAEQEISDVIVYIRTFQKFE